MIGNKPPRPNPHIIYKDYKGRISKEDLLDNGLYVVCARSAFIGLWSQSEDGFIVARRKMASWYLFVENHWDDEFFHDGGIINRGTVIPIRMIGCVIDDHEIGMIEFLKKVELDNPIVDGWNSVKDRSDCNDAWLDHYRSSRDKKKKKPVYQWIKDRKE